MIRARVVKIQMNTESTLSTFVAVDGDNLAIQDWPLDDDQPMRGVVLLVHGLGEHAGRYDHVARRLNSWGFAVRGPDQYGHGESGGARGGLPTAHRLLDDLADIVDSTRLRMSSKMPLILRGHSLGGLVAARFVSLAMRPVEALVLSSPALDPGLSAFQKFLVSVLPKIAPDLRVGNGLDPSMISHDPEVVAAYRADKLVKPQGSRDFAAAAPKEVVTAHCFETLYHEIFNELDPEPVFAELKKWLDARF